MQFIRDAFGPNIEKTRNPRRKLVAKKYIEEIHSSSRFIDSRTGNSMSLEKAIEKYGVIDVQLINSSGTLFLDKNLKKYSFLSY